MLPLYFEQLATLSSDLVVTVIMEEDVVLEDVQMRAAHTIAKNGGGVAASDGLIYLHHPGYDDWNVSVLFTLPSCSVKKDGNPCAEYEVAWQGCYAIAIDQQGFFTKRKERSSERVPCGQALKPRSYWYHLDVETEGDLYATGLDFRAWTYDPEKVPDIWPSAVPWRGREDDDQENEDCCITGEDGGVQRAHLVEKTEWQWWIENNMTEHSSTPGHTRATEIFGQETSVPGNLIPLSDGLHRIWDNNYFCLFPLRVTDGTWRLHSIFLRPLEKAVRNHHRRPLRGGLRHTSAACAYSRFVSSIYRKYELTFLAKSVKSYLGGSKLVPRFLSPDDILQRRSERVRSTSPSKKSQSGSPRKRTNSSSQQEEDSDDEGPWESQRECHSQTDSAIGVEPDDSPDRGRLETRKEDAQRAILRDERRKRRKLERCD